MNRPMEDAQPRQQKIARIAVACLLGLLGLWISATFLPALIWAVVIAVAIDPPYLRAMQRWRTPLQRSLLAAAVTSTVTLVVLVPVAACVTQAVHEAHDLARWIAAARASGVPVPHWVHELPLAGDELARWWQDNLATPQAATARLSRLDHSQLVAQSRLIGSGLLHRTVIFAFTMIALFFLLRDRDSIVRQGTLAGERVLGPSAQRIGHQAIRSIRGTIDGLVLVGIGEGLVMALVYLLLGVPHPLLLGAATAVAAMIPFGAALMFAIAALLLVGQSAVTAAIAVVVIGLVVVGIADHFIRPALIGGATRLPFLWVLVGILGGVESFGLLGLFVGPATMAVLVMLWREYLEGDPRAVA
jgi:predicted PurR-regulated permease PerM